LKLSFPEIVRDCLAKQGISTQIELLSHLKISSLERLADIVEKFNPDLLVLQLGHFESTPKKVSQAIGLRSSSDSSTWVADANASFTTGVLWRVRASLKTWLDRLISLSGFRHLDLSKVEADLRALMQFVEKSGIAHTILLAPIPCPDPVIMKHRVAITRVFEGVAQHSKCRFVSFEESIGKKSAEGLPRLFADHAHLGAEGQKIVGLAVACEICDLLSAGGCPSAARATQVF
jgi:hypothetical protein